MQTIRDYPRSSWDLRGCRGDASEVFREGFASFHNGHGLVNPHGKGTVASMEWDRGYHSAMYQVGC